MSRTKNLRQPARIFRTAIARGLADNPLAVDPEGGDKGAGIIRGMAILTRGEALGHDLWCDSTTLSQCVDAINATGEKGIKARFTHPDISGDGLGKYTGRVKNAALDATGDIVRADLHFSSAAHDTPDGDLAGYLMKLAAEDPEAFGNSIAFTPDLEAEEQFLADNSDEGKFTSPDPENENQLPHARLNTLHAVDAVDEPAANPSGLFHRGHQIASEAERLAAYSLGLSTDRPRLTVFDTDPERVAGFVQRFLSRHNLTLTVKDKTMTTAELDTQLRKHFSGRPGPGRDLGRRMADDKEDKGDQVNRGAQEEGDADKHEGHEEGKDEKRGDDLAAEGDGNDDELDDEAPPDKGKELDDEESDAELADPDDAREGLADEEDEEDADEPKQEKAKKLARGGDAPGDKDADDEAARQKEYQDVEKDKAKKSKAPAEKGTNVQSPGTEPDAIGPLGDPSKNVGYAAGAKECRRFIKAFGTPGAIWFSEGKTFTEAQTLHAAAIKTERDELKKENERLKTKLAAKRGVSPLSAGETSVANGTDRPGFEAFTAGLANQIARRNLN